MPDAAWEFEGPRSPASPVTALGESADLVMEWCDHSKPRLQVLLAFARRAALLHSREHADLGMVLWNV